MDLTQEEAEKLCLATVAHNGAATESEVQAVLDWAIELRTDVALLENVLLGLMTVFPGEDGKMRFKMTEAGLKRGAELAAEASKNGAVRDQSNG